MLAEKKSSMSSAEIESLIEENISLRNLQNRENTPEELATIPVLSREDLPKEWEKTQRVEKHAENITGILHPLSTSGIRYVNFLFPVDHIDPQTACDMTLICELLGYLDTENYTRAEFQAAEHLYTGGITMHPEIIRHPERPLQRKILVSTKFLPSEDMEKGLLLVEEELYRSKFTDLEHIRSLIRMVRTNHRAGLVQYGHRLAVNRAKGQFSPLAAYQDGVSGIRWYQYLCDMAQNFGEEDAKRLEKVYRSLFQHPDRRIVNIIASASDMEMVWEIAKSSVERFPVNVALTDKHDETAYTYRYPLRAEGFVTSSDVQFVAKVGQMPHWDYLRGELAILQDILSTEYLYNEIRAKGGAYGTGCSFSVNGLLALYSYRDPNLARTKDVYDTLDQAIKNLHLEDEDLTRYLIGTIGGLDTPLSVLQKGMQDTMEYLTGYGYHERNRLLREALEAKTTSFADYADTVKTALDSPCLVVIGSSEALEKERHRFAEISTLS